VSCYTDANDFDINTSDVKLLKSISIDGALIYNFDYYADRKISAIITISGGGISGFTSYQYVNDTVFKTISGLFSSKFKSFRTNSNTIKLEEYDTEDNLLFFYLNQYLSSNCALSKTESYTQFGQLYAITDYNYTDSYCSYNSKRASYNGDLKNKYTITKDDKYNGLASINEWPIFERKHNVIEYLKWDANENLVLSSSYNSTFVYDINNYPIQEIRTSLSGITKVYTYEYY
jgi:hypothetical protein